MPIASVQVSRLYDDPFSEKTHFGLNNHLTLYLEVQTQYTLRFPGMPITMEEVSKLGFLVYGKNELLWMSCCMIMPLHVKKELSLTLYVHKRSGER